MFERHASLLLLDTYAIHFPAQWVSPGRSTRAPRPLREASTLYRGSFEVSELRGRLGLCHDAQRSVLVGLVDADLDLGKYYDPCLLFKGILRTFSQSGLHGHALEKSCLHLRIPFLLSLAEILESGHAVTEYEHFL